MREVLIRYLLGELDADEQQKLQFQLRASPELREELAKLRACYEAHRNDELDKAPPSGLASRTAERVMSCDGVDELPRARDKDGFSTGGDPPPGILGWSLADLTVAGGVVLAVSMLIFPALRNSRDGTRRDLCGYKIHQIYLSSAAFAQDNGGVFPKIGPRDHAGSFVTQLVARGYAHPADIAVWLVCPDSPLAEKLRSGVEFHVPSAESIRGMSSNQLSEFTATASPCFAYRLPHRIGHELGYVRNDHDEFSPIFSDTPGDQDASLMSPNHGGTIVQIHFADGSLRSFTNWKLPYDDDMSHNDLGVVAAGVQPKDIVMGGSEAMPGYELVVRGR